MRVVAGTAKGKTLLAVPGDSTRPILDRVKTSLFDILRPEIQGIKILDLFGGSGAVGIEALSQGAEHCTFIEINKKAVATIEKNLSATKLNHKAEVRLDDAFRYLKNCKTAFDLIYIAPPQYKALWIQAIRAIAERPQLLNQNGQIIVQIDPIEDEQLELTEFNRVSDRRYGSTLLVFYRIK